MKFKFLTKLLMHHSWKLSTGFPYVWFSASANMSVGTCAVSASWPILVQTQLLSLSLVNIVPVLGNQDSTCSLTSPILKVVWKKLHHLKVWQLNPSMKFSKNRGDRPKNCVWPRRTSHSRIPSGRRGSSPHLVPLINHTYTHTHRPLKFTRWHAHVHTQSGNAGENSPHLLLPRSLVSSPRFNGCSAKARLPPPMSHNYLLTAQTNRATQRVTSNQNCHRWLSLVIKSARPLPVRRVRERKEDGEKWQNVIAAL